MSQNPEQPIVVVGPDGQPIGTMVQGGLDTNGDGAADATEQRERPLVHLVEQPAKVMRVGSMVKQLLEEVRSAPLDEASRRRLREIHERTIKSSRMASRRSSSKSSTG